MQVKKIRRARPGDLAQVMDIDARITGVRKARYWAEIQRRYGGRRGQRFFFVAERRSSARRSFVEGYIVGEVRDWEFGSPPCGWVFGIDVRPDMRLAGIGTRLLEALCTSFRRVGVTKVRTMLARDNTLILSFFRSQGMMSGPFIPLEMDLGA